MFQYCAYYGLSAPLLMVLSKQQIDKLFELPLHKNTAVLLENLQWELEKLKQILGNKANVPTVPDESSVITSYFLRGVNAALLDKDKFDAEHNTPIDTLDTDLASSLGEVELDSATDLFGGLDLSLDSESHLEPTTEDISLEDDMIPSDAEKADSDLSWDIDPVDGEGFLDLEDTSEMPAVFQNEIDTVQEDSDWVMPSDLIARGRMLPSTEADRFNSFSQYTLWMCNKAREELGEKNYAILQAQYETLPLKLMERITLDKKNYNLKKEYPKLYSILNTLVVQSCSIVDDKPKIDYVLDKITTVINQSSSQTAVFLGVNFDLLKNLGNIWAYNTRINSAVVTGPLSTQSIQSKRRVVDGLLEDCRALLGIDMNGNKIATTRTSSSQGGHKAVPAANSDTFDRLMQGDKFRDLMESEDREAALEAIQQIRQSGNEGYEPLAYMYTNPMEIIFQMRIRMALQDLSKNILIKFGIADVVDDPDEINQLGIELAKKFKIGGLYYGYDDIFRAKCLAIRQCCNQTDFSITPDSDNKYYDSLYTEIQLVYVYLLSLKARIGDAQ